MIRWLIILMIAGGLTFAGATVMLGKRTFFGHVRAIWATEEVQEMKKGIEEKAAPAVERVKRGVEAGLNEAGRSQSAGQEVAAALAAVRALATLDRPTTA